MLARRPRRGLDANSAISEGPIGANNVTPVYTSASRNGNPLALSFVCRLTSLVMTRTWGTLQPNVSPDIEAWPLAVFRYRLIKREGAATTTV
jgi:hypothetical protein